MVHHVRARCCGHTKIEEAAEPQNCVCQSIKESGRLWTVVTDQLLSSGAHILQVSCMHWLLGISRASTPPICIYMHTYAVRTQYHCSIYSSVRLYFFSVSLKEMCVGHAAWKQKQTFELMQYKFSLWCKRSL